MIISLKLISEEVISFSGIVKVINASLKFSVKVLTQKLLYHFFHIDKTSLLMLSILIQSYLIEHPGTKSLFIHAQRALEH